MRAQAELRHDSSHLAPFFDDDETIATAPTVYSSPRKGEVRGPLSIDTSQGKVRHDSTAKQDFVDNNSITRPRSNASHPVDKRHHSIGDTEFARRVKSAASIMLAPCVAPSLSSILKTGGQNPRGAAVAQSKSSFLGSESEVEPGAFAGMVRLHPAASYQLSQTLTCCIFS
jgi:hypothetical protein